MIILLFPNKGFSDYGWWYEFPEQIVASVATQLGVDAKVLFRTGSTTLPPWVDTEIVTVEKLYDPRWCLHTIRRLAGDADRFVVHQHTVPIHTWLWPVCKLWGRRCRTVFTDHDPPNPIGGVAANLKRAVKQVLRETVYYPDWIVPVSEFNAHVWRTHFGDRRIRAIENGIRVPEVPAPAPMKEPPNRLLFVGRLMEYKGLRPLLKAMLLARQQEMELFLEVVGEGPEREYIESFIEKHQMGRQIQFSGYLKDPSLAYRRSDILIVPSTWEEPFGLVSVEAQAHYLPCIYSNRGGLPETQVDGETGRMLESVTPEEIVAAVRHLQSDRTAFEQMRFKARENAQRFSMKQMVENYVELYRSMLGAVSG